MWVSYSVSEEGRDDIQPQQPVNCYNCFQLFSEGFGNDALPELISSIHSGSSGRSTCKATWEDRVWGLGGVWGLVCNSGHQFAING